MPGTGDTEANHTGTTLDFQACKTVGETGLWEKMAALLVLQRHTGDITAGCDGDVPALVPAGRLFALLCLHFSPVFHLV